MRLLHAQFVFALATTASALVLREESLNATTTALETPAQSLPSPSNGEEDEQKSSTHTRFFKPRPEVTAPGFENPPTPATSVQKNVVTTDSPDVGDIIKSYIPKTTPSPAAALPSVHLEKTADGFQPRPPASSGANFHAPHMEASAPGFDQATTAANAQDGRPQETSPPSRVNTPADIPLGPVTLRPTPVTSAQVVTIDGKPVTTNVVDFQYAVENSVVPVGQTVTINGVPVAINVNSGTSVFVAGDKTTTLPPSIQAAQFTNGAQPVSVATTVIDGTTKYLLGGQTLAPGQAVTVNNVPISLTTKDGTTVLVLGSSTTTLVPNTASRTGSEWGSSTVPTPQNVGGTGPARPTSTGAASIPLSPGPLVSQLLGVLGLILPLL